MELGASLALRDRSFGGTGPQAIVALAVLLLISEWQGSGLGHVWWLFIVYHGSPRGNGGVHFVANALRNRTYIRGLLELLLWIN